MFCIICNKEIVKDSQFINGNWYHNECIEKTTKRKLLKESEEMKAIEWLNKKRLDTSLTGIELNYLNILYYLILNLLEVSNETK